VEDFEHFVVLAVLSYFGLANEGVLVGIVLTKCHVEGTFQNIPMTYSADFAYLPVAFGRGKYL